MREHDQLLMIGAAILIIILIGMLFIEWLMGRGQDAMLDDFADSATKAAFDEECRRFWRAVNDAEIGRQRHLDESEAAAIAHQRGMAEY